MKYVGSVLILSIPQTRLHENEKPTLYNRVVNRLCILCLIGSQVGSGTGRVGSSFAFCSPLY
ncbi:hypothetical protein Hanom_Chr02g00164541 [Helianthus anomalus]